MGHSEMLLAVAGLKDGELKQLTQKLSSGDWSDFPAAEGLALQFADKLTRDPAGRTKTSKPWLARSDVTAPWT
jgi:hypothetical protein